jgi:hypothetical protein
MSLYTTHVLCSDGKIYDDPVWEGRDPDGSIRWFLCTDELELVLRVDDKDITKDLRHEFPNLKFIEYVSRPSPEHPKTYKRIFDGKFALASTRLGLFIAIPPPPQKYKRVIFPKNKESNGDN